MNKTVADLRNNQFVTQNLDKQFEQFASAQTSCPHGVLSCNTDPNPMQVNDLGTRSGLQIEELVVEVPEAVIEENTSIAVEKKSHEYSAPNKSETTSSIHIKVEEEK